MAKEKQTETSTRLWEKRSRRLTEAQFAFLLENKFDPSGRGSAKRISSFASRFNRRFGLNLRDNEVGQLMAVAHKASKRVSGRQQLVLIREDK